MKILFITGEYPPQISGIGDYTFYLAQELSQIGFHITVLTSAAENSEPTAHPVKVLRQVNGWKKSSWPALHTIFSNEKPDIVHLQYHTCSFGNDLFITLLGFKIKVHFPKISFFTTYHEFAAPYKRLGLLPLFAASAQNIVTNDRDLGRLVRIIPSGFIKKRVRYIPLGSGIPLKEKSAAQISQIRANLNLTDSSSLIVRFGFLHQAAVSEIIPLLSVFAELKTEGMPFKFLWIGKQDPAARSQLNAEIQTLGIRDLVSFYDACPPAEVSALLQSADIGIAPYQDGVSERRSGFLALLTHGVPTLTTLGQEPPAPLKDQENVFLLPRSDKKAWKTVLLNLIHSPALRERVSKKAKETSKRYQWKEIAKAHSTAYLYQIAQK